MKTKLIIAVVACLIPFFGNAQAKKKITQAQADSIKSERTQEIKDSLANIMADAKKGDAVAMNEVGTWYYEGKHVKQDYKEAYDWWSKSALQQNTRAIANLGMCYQFGRGVEKDSVDAIRLYEKSIKDGNMALFQQREKNANKNAFDAMLIGNCYENGVGVTKDFAKASKYYGFAASKGSVDGMRQAGICCLNSKQNAEALKYFEKGAAKGDVTSEFWAGKMLLGNMNVPEDKNQGVVYVLKAAEAGMPAAENLMGELYAEGKGVTKNLAQSADWYRKAAQKGHGEAMWKYGNALKNGEGVDQNYDEALFWMAEAVPQGYQRAFRNLVEEMKANGSDLFLNYLKGMKLYQIDGNMKDAADQFKQVSKAKIPEGKIMEAVVLASNRNEKPNAKKAAKELEKLAPSNPEAAYYLAMLYENGNGVDQNMLTAIDYYRKASDMGYGPAQSKLADIYYEGLGTDKDLITAVNLYQKAAATRHLTEKGATRLAEAYENGLAGLPQDKKKAEELKNQKHPDNKGNLLKTANL